MTSLDLGFQDRNAIRPTVKMTRLPSFVLRPVFGDTLSPNSEVRPYFTSIVQLTIYNEIYRHNSRETALGVTPIREEQRPTLPA
jgi:hypothetical protein